MVMAWPMFSRLTGRKKTSGFCMPITTTRTANAISRATMSGSNRWIAWARGVVFRIFDHAYLAPRGDCVERRASSGERGARTRKNGL